jgi:hypothetical protein
LDIRHERFVDSVFFGILFRNQLVGRCRLAQRQHQYLCQFLFAPNNHARIGQAFGIRGNRGVHIIAIGRRSDKPAGDPHLAQLDCSTILEQIAPLRSTAGQSQQQNHMVQFIHMTFQKESIGSGAV